MAQEERLSGALQENVLTLLCFDDEHCKLIRAAVVPQLFESAPLKAIATHAIDFIDQYGEAIKDHLPDMLEDVLAEDDSKARTYKRVLDSLFESKDSVNAKFVVSQLNAFVRMQRFKSGLIKSIELVEEGKVDEAELAMNTAMKSQAVVFDGGFDFNDAEAIGQVFDNPEEEGFDLGIPEFDSRGIKPRRKELTALIAPRKRGKSWFLTHCAKQALLQRWSVLVITLEMSQPVYATRMLQSFFSIARREAELRVTKLKRDKDGQLEALISERLDRGHMQDADTRASAIARAKREFKRRAQFKIKSFPMHSLTLMEAEAYLDNLARFENFVPDVVCWDYPRIMKHDAKNLRIELGQTFAGIRGLAQARNHAAIMVHQGNRDSESAEWVTADMAEEDISLVAAVDIAFTYSQTRQEKKLGLARMMADYVRNGDSQIAVLMSQAYAVGQFCLDSTPIDSGYWDLMKEKGEREDRRRRRTDDESEDHTRERGRP